jgi:excinuclease UvrABC helicase subunit UvrB
VVDNTGDIMEYKPTARSPHYGKIFAYDQNGKEVQSIDILQVQLVHEGKNYTIKELLKLVIELQAGEKALQEQQRELVKHAQVLQQKIDLMIQLFEIQSVKQNADTIL